MAPFETLGCPFEVRLETFVALMGHLGVTLAIMGSHLGILRRHHFNVGKCKNANANVSVMECLQGGMLEQFHHFPTFPIVFDRLRTFPH